MIPPYDEARVLLAFDRIEAIYLEAGRVPDLRALVWATRMQHTADSGVPWDAAEATHLRELRAALGLPVPPLAVDTTWPRVGASYYTSLTDPRLDPPAFARRLQDAGMTWTRVWLLDAWAFGTGTGCYAGFVPWEQDVDGRYDLWRVSARYLERLHGYVTAMNACGVLPQLSGLELYTWSDRKQGLLWVPDVSRGPLRFNRQGMVYRDDGAFDRIGQQGGEDAFLGHLYADVVRTLAGLRYVVELANEMPEKPLHARLRDRWREAGYTGWIAINRHEDTPGQYANMAIGRDYDQIAFHGRRDLGYLDEDYPREPTHRTFRAFYASGPDPTRIVLSSDGCRATAHPDHAYDYAALGAVFRDARARGFSVEHQSRMKLRGFTENRITLDDLETDWLRALRG